MKKTTLLLCLILGLGWPLGLTLSAQTPTNPLNTTQVMKGGQVVCFMGDTPHQHIHPPQAYLEQLLNGARPEPKSEFIVTYKGFTEEAKAAFQFAVDIWASLISSPVPIRVEANWTPLAAGTLGSARPGTFYRNFPGAVKLNTWYPVALAEKMSGRGLNNNNQFDIVTNFNSDFNRWYLGTDLNPPLNQFDLVTVVLHELAHGLGFVSLNSVENGEGSLLLQNFPSIFAHYLRDGSLQPLLFNSNYPSPSVALFQAFTSESLLFQSPLLTQRTSTPASLHSPASYSQGSSISHLSDIPFKGTVNTLMTHAAAPGTGVHDPGPVTLAMFADMGWAHTYLRPDTIQSTETVAASFEVKVKITSDSGFQASTAKLFYSLDSMKTTPTEVALSPTATPDEYSATIPGGSAIDGKTIAYYVAVKDKDNREYLSPSEATNTRFNNYFYFYVGVDNIPPTLLHTPIRAQLLVQDSVEILAGATDLFGIDSVWVEYTIDNQARPPFLLRRSSPTSSQFTGAFSFAGLQGGETIRYRIIANDRSQARNRSFSPSATTFHSFVVENLALGAALDSYQNNFDAAGAADDFFGDDFSIRVEPGFSNPAIHSEHPYRDAPLGQTVDYTYVLRRKIRVSANNALMAFDEIALVEPGESGIPFGGVGFWDYVIVEGSKDNGATWIPLLDGYDARAHNIWESTYNGSLQGGNSSAIGAPGLYRNRVINLRNRFNTGDEILIRFRLNADESAYGWGWVIDNLKIQTSDIITTLAQTAEVGAPLLFPNPSSGEVTLQGDFSQGVQILVYSATGKIVDSQVFDAGSQPKLDLSKQPAGLYLIRVRSGADSYTLRLMIQR
ncbi:T9SS type A sorting domain-containing protein [Eisenibacter elegans]|uniref:T9SS type A sorting domain-containing protein n=1 Tax=Eisenibacter elegans TaxID=997 RepID=UPI0009D752AC|nr:T9SS type A sorting domain-containing protein [Eisenibacter elegans]